MAVGGRAGRLRVRTHRELIELSEPGSAVWPLGAEPPDENHTCPGLISMVLLKMAIEKCY